VSREPPLTSWPPHVSVIVNKLNDYPMVTDMTASSVSVR